MTQKENNKKRAFKKEYYIARIVFIFAMVFVFAKAAHASDYYVNVTTGNDDNPGTEAEPFKTVQEGAATAIAGDNVIVEDGTYDDSDGGEHHYIQDDDGNISVFNIDHSGSTGSPITIEAQHAGQAILEGNGFADFGIEIMPGVHDIVIQGFEIKDCDISGIMGMSPTNLPADAIHDISISRNQIDQIGNRDIESEDGGYLTSRTAVLAPQGSYNFSLDSNIFNDIGRTNDSTLDHALYLFGYDHLITNDLFYNDVSGWMIDISDVGDSSSEKNIKITNNTFSGGSSYIEGTLGQIKIENDNSDQVENILISNNISYGALGSLVYWSSDTVTATSAYIRNNLTTEDTIDSNAPSGVITYADNVFNSDPLFSDPGNNDFHLQYDLTHLSPAVSMADEDDAPDHDLDQESRPKNSGTDAGAYEFVSSDNTSPVISEVTPVSDPTADTTPDYTFTTDEAGTIIYGGDCSSSDTTADIGPNTVTFNTLSSGAHSNCTVKVRDASSNDSNVIDITSFTIDNSAPTLGSFTINNDEATTNSTSVTLNIVCPSDSWTPVEMAFGDTASPNANWTACAATQAYTIPSGDGLKTVYMRFRDGGGNTTSDTTDTITLDSTGPALSFDDNVAAGPVQSDTITPNWGDASVKEWDYSADGNCSTDAGAYSFTDIDSLDQDTETNNGSYICLYAEDGLGNKSTLASAHPINIDITPPVVSITSPTSGTVAGTDKISFTDDGNNPKCSPDNSHWTSCTSDSTTFASLTGWGSIAGGATFTLYLEDTDAASNTGTDSVADLTKSAVGESDDPTFTINSGTDAGPTKTDTINVTVNDAAAITASEYGFSSDDTCDENDTYGNGNAFTSGSDFTIAGNHTDYLCVMATNEYSNTSYDLIGQLNTDNSAPTLGSFTINNDETTTNSTSVTLNIVCPSDSWTPVEMAFGDTASPNANWTACAATQAYTIPSSDGLKTVYMRFRDGGGNTTSDTTDTITLDTTSDDGTAPVSTADPAGGTYNSTQLVTLSCVDNEGGSGCAAIYYTTDGTEPDESSSQYNDPITISSNTTLKFFAEDVATNSEETNTEKYTIDTSASASADANRPDLTIDGDTYHLKPGKTYYSDSKTFSFDGETDGIENGHVEIYDGHDLLETSDISSNGKWDQKVHVDDADTYKISFKFYSSSDELVKEIGTFKILVDDEDPKFTDLPKLLHKRPGDMIWWKAKDDDDIAFYRYYLNGKIKKTIRKHLYLPASLSRGYHTLKVRAYDRAGNVATRRIRVLIY